MADGQQQSINLNATQLVSGLNTDSLIQQVQQGQTVYALNSRVESFDGNEVSYQNDQANSECVQFPEGYKVIGVSNIPQLNKVIFFLTNPSTGNSQIGQVANNSCTYEAILDDTISGSDLLNFSVEYPIHKVEVKTTNCGTQLYWTDRFNPRRYFDLDNLPWKEVLIAGILTPVVGQIDANKMLVQPNFKIPKIDATQVNIGGNLVEGDYQFAIQYADALGNGYTSYYSVSNEVRIFLEGKISTNYNEVTNNSITLRIENLDTSGLYDYFNLAVIKSINAITSVELVGTFYIQRADFDYTYTGTEQSNANIKLTLNDIFERSNYYDIAGTLTQVDNVLAWGDLIKEEDISYQSIWSKVNVQWETWQVPDNPSVNYSNGVTSANIQGYMRDEVYPLEGCFFFKNGKQSARFHIPGRIANSFDLDIIPGTNEDIQGTSKTLCSGPNPAVKRWQVYNTGSVIGFSSEYNSNDNCNPQPYQYGLMGYHESTEKYPNNPFIWGPLANQPIRHHRFPDSLITHIHDQNPYPVGSDAYNNYQHNLYPIGVKIDINQLKALIAASNLTQTQKDDIVGFKIMRGDRVNNKSIIAKGLLYNCGKYTKETSTYYYPNYPFNDVNPDPFISSQIVQDKSGDNQQYRLDDFQRGRYTFHSPDTSFYHPSGIDGSFLKMETAEYGQCKSHFVQVKDNAREKLKTVKTLEIALAGAISSVVGGEFNLTTGTVTTTEYGLSLHAENFFPTFNNLLEIIDKLIPYINYGWQYNGVGFYGNYQPIANNGTKIRSIDNGGYIITGVQGTFGDDHPINNKYRESSVYLHTTDDNFPYAYENAAIAADNSRVTAGQLGICGTSTNFYRNIDCYYAAIKRYLPGQWGQIFSYTPIDTGRYYLLTDTKIPTIFGGDVFINRFALKRKHAFFDKTSVNKPDGYDIDYDVQGNVGYPIWYYSTSNVTININNGNINNAVTNFVNALDNWILNIILLGIPVLIMGLILLVTLIKDGLLTSLGIKVTNLECYSGDGLYEQGQGYLYAYGIPYFFVESEVNVDMRQATNIAEGDFYPHVGTDIPDDWLQETNVPIIQDNTYVYNKTYSKQHKETPFTTLRADYDPNKPCFTYFPNRVIWSDKSSVEETKNNWVIYRPGNEKDLPKTFGLLTALDTLEQNQILVRFENRSQIYNAFVTMQVQNGPDAYVGNTQLFANIPIDLSNTDIGAYGSQHKFLLRTPFGTCFVDAKRGQIILMQKDGIQDIAMKGMDKWFANYLPFQIQNYFPDIPTDNAFNGIGLHGVYDDLYKTLFITKLDYIPLMDDIKFDGVKFYLEETLPDRELTVPGPMECCPEGYKYNPARNTCVNILNGQTTTDLIPCGAVTEEIEGYNAKTIISLTDPEYFCNKSWTLSYSFKTNSWISYHSFIPNYYVQYPMYFQSGINSDESLWDHNLNFTEYNKYYGETYPYIIEYPIKAQLNDEILQNVEDFTTALIYQDRNNYTEPDEIIYFNKSIIYNNQQCTGILNLIPKDSLSLQNYGTYPKNNTDSRDILVDKRDSMFSYNQFYNLLKDASVNIWEDTCEFTETNKELNQSNMDYGLRSFRKDTMRGKFFIIRHVLDDRNDVKLISKFSLFPTVKSYI